jgi:hypothetical protein
MNVCLVEKVKGIARSERADGFQSPPRLLESRASPELPPLDRGERFQSMRHHVSSSISSIDTHLTPLSAPTPKPYHSRTIALVFESININSRRLELRQRQPTYTGLSMRPLLPAMSDAARQVTE